MSNPYIKISDNENTVYLDDEKFVFTTRYTFCENCHINKLGKCRGVPCSSMNRKDCQSGVFLRAEQDKAPEKNLVTEAIAMIADMKKELSNLREQVAQLVKQPVQETPKIDTYPASNSPAYGYIAVPKPGTTLKGINDIIYKYAIVTNVYPLILTSDDGMYQWLGDNFKSENFDFLCKASRESINGAESYFMI